MFCETKNLSVKYYNYNVLYNISILIEMNKTTIILGKNGSGKTTLLRCINLLCQPSSGKLNHNFNKPFPMLFQKPIIFDNTVQYNFEILGKIKKIKPELKWYNKFALEKIKYRSIRDISGGEKQKLFLSRIFSLNSDIIILDEPNQNLDLESDRILTNLILEEKKSNKTIICTLHDYDMIKKIADNVILLDQGKLVFSGSSIDFFANQ